MDEKCTFRIKKEGVDVPFGRERLHRLKYLRGYSRNGNIGEGDKLLCLKVYTRIQQQRCVPGTAYSIR